MILCGCFFIINLLISAFDIQRKSYVKNKTGCCGNQIYIMLKQMDMVYSGIYRTVNIFKSRIVVKIPILVSLIRMIFMILLYCIKANTSKSTKSEG